MKSRQFMEGISQVGAHFANKFREARHEVAEHGQEIYDEFHRGISSVRGMILTAGPSALLGAWSQLRYEGMGFSERAARSMTYKWVLPALLTQVVVAEVLPAMVTKAPELRRIGRDAIRGIGDAFHRGTAKWELQHPPEIGVGGH